MKSAVPFLLCLLTIPSLLTGCAQSDNAPTSSVESSQENIDSAFQEASDRGYKAKEVAEENFADYMKDNNQYNYTIEQTNWGFIASELPEYIIGFKYVIDEETKYYGYKMNVDDNYKCTIIEEGTEIADFIFS